MQLDDLLTSLVYLQCGGEKEEDNTKITRFNHR